jgi:DNA-binding response OmpR family regulator
LAKPILFVAAEATRLEPLLAAARAAGLEALTRNPSEAVEELARGRACDLLVVDLEPPALEGFAVIRAYRAARGEDAPVLALSEGFKREHIEGMLENERVRRLFPLDLRTEELLFWVNEALFPEARRSRKTPRIPASFTLSVADRKRLLRGRAFTLSEEGLFLETTLAAQPGQTLALRFRLPGRRSRADTIATHCQVVWANPRPPAGQVGTPPYGLGLRFLDLDPQSREAIKAFVFQNLLEQSI